MPSDPTLYDDAFAAMQEVIAELRPEVVYAWNTRVRDSLLRHPEALRYVGMADMMNQLSVYIFVPVEGGLKGNALRRLRYERGVMSPRHLDGWYRDLVRRHLGKAMHGTPAEVKEKIRALAAVLKEWVETKRLGADETSLYFNDSDRYTWRSVHIGLFARRLKDVYDLRQGANAGLNAMLSERSVEKCPTDESLLRPDDKLLLRIKEIRRSGKP